MTTKPPRKVNAKTSTTETERETIWLNSIAVTGFKSLKQIEVPISPITVLLGSNSSGKSSIMQSILLASQNLENPTDYVFDLNGVAVTLGTYREVAHRGLPERPITFRFDFAGSSPAVPEGSISSMIFTLRTPWVEDDNRKSSIPITSCALEIKVPRRNKTRLVSSPISTSNQGVFADNLSKLRLEGTIHKSSVSQFDMANSGDVRSRMLARSAKQATEASVLDISMNLQSRSRNFSGTFFPIPQFSQNYCEIELFVHLIGCYVALKAFHRANLEGTSESRTRVHVYETNRSLTQRQDFAGLEKRVRKALSLRPEGKARKIMNLDSKEISLIFELIELHRKQKLEEATTNLEKLYKNLSATINFDELSEDGLVKAFFELNKTHYSKLFFEAVFSSLPSIRGLYEPTIERASRIESLLIEYLGSSIHYLGPLRAHSLIDQSGWSPRSRLIPFGSKGENLGKVLDSPQSKIKRLYPLPPKKSDTANSIQAKVSLISALNAWVAWFNLGSSVGVDDQAAWGTHLELDKEKMFQKGTGVSQILPVIALCLTARSGSTVMIEQPELHLHPGLQQRLGTFFALLSKTGRRFVIETHSEYLVTRLRREIAVGKIDADALGLLFVKAKKSKNGHTHTELRKASVSQSGVVPIWPEGFFDFTTEDKLDIRIAASKSEG